MGYMDNKHFFVFYNDPFDSDNDSFNSDGLGWHGEFWWLDGGHGKDGFVIESEVLDSEDMDDGIRRIKTCVSFNHLDFETCHKISMAGVPEHLINDMLMHLTEKK